jgi:probable 2-oxoglutarate dehydrogenase E1 component DHKTD1
MPHRGRLNLLIGMLQFPPAKLFRKLKGISEFPEHVKATGDVPSHFTSSVDLAINGKTIHVTVLPGPSHLEVANPVSMGKTRARHQSLKQGGYQNQLIQEGHSAEWSDKVLNLQIHGDAAFVGQGVNQEMLELSMVPHFEVGGSVHLVVNNQLGFTTPADRGRSSRYCTDLAKITSAPVLHVNGVFPEMVVKATRIACEYQRKFRKDVFVDLNCYRQWGHNELDDPTLTNPGIYNIIQATRTVPDMYADLLVNEGVMSKEEVGETVAEYSEWLNGILKSMDTYVPQETFLQKHWSGIQQAEAAVTGWDTGTHLDILRYVGEKSVAYPQGFNIHPHLLKTHITARLNKMSTGNTIDWATAEALAMGSLLYQGYNVRISGQDVGRGTFSHRHVMLVDQKTNEMYIPLNSLIDGQRAYLEVANSILSEEAVLAFEYGMSIENPYNLVIWEAQFGDFFNGAQIPIDTYIASGETKWMMCSGLTMLLPHGYDGAGPEHSSCRLERFLQLSDSNESKPDGDDVNINIANPTTPAQYFHLLRKQVIQNYRKPLILVTPKTLLRSPEATSSLIDMGPQTTFMPVIGDHVKADGNIQRVIFVSGKHYYTLDKKRKALDAKDVALVRLEGLSPFPTLSLQQEVAKYRNAKIFVWSQEEHQNMGAWNYVRPRFENLIGRRLKYAGRGPLATPAVGIGQMHQKEAELVTIQPFTIR